jgi:hypothetical protein
MRQFALDDAEDAALLVGDEDAEWIGRAVTTISLVDIDMLDLAAGKSFGVFDHDAQGVAVIGIARPWSSAAVPAILGRAAWLASPAGSSLVKFIGKKR